MKKETCFFCPSLHRQAEIPVTLCLPEGQGPWPFVLMLHGHGSYRDENVGFVRIAEAMAELGIASLRMDLPGCGESKEAFTENCISNMKADLLDCLSYALENYPLRRDRVGLFGYSMGGRVCLEQCIDDSSPFLALCLLAPAVDLSRMRENFGTEEGYEGMKTKARLEGFAEYTTFYGKRLCLSPQWFSDLEKYEMDELLGLASLRWQKPCRVIYAVDDTIVDPESSRALIRRLDAESFPIPEDGHCFGFFSSKTHILEMVAKGAAAFFQKNLCREF